MVSDWRNREMVNMNFVAKVTLVITLVLLIGTALFSHIMLGAQGTSGLGASSSQVEDIPLKYGATAQYLGHYSASKDLDIYVFQYDLPPDTNYDQDVANAFSVLIFMWRKAEAGWKGDLSNHADVLLWLSKDDKGGLNYHYLTAVSSSELKAMLDTDPKTFDDMMNTSVKHFLNTKLGEVSYDGKPVKFVARVLNENKFITDDQYNQIVRTE
jgi:hypothetical protein